MGERKEAAKEEFSKLSLKDKVLRVRHKLEKIIHKKETNQNKAIDLLRILERIEITEEVLSVTKINLTLEALMFIIKDDNIIRKTEKVLKILRRSTKQPVPIKITTNKWRETDDKFKGTEIDGEEIIASENLPKVDKVHWMDQFIENDKKLCQKLDSLNKKLETMSSDVQEISPITESSSNSSLDKLLNPPASSKNVDTNQMEEKVTKIQKRLHKALSDDDKDEVYHQLKKLSELQLTKEIIQNTRVKKTIKNLEKKSSE